MDGIGYLKFYSKFLWNMLGKLAIFWQQHLRTFFYCLTKYCRWPQAAGCERNFSLSLAQNDSASFSQASDDRSACPLGCVYLEWVTEKLIKKKFRGTCRQLQCHLLMNETMFLGDFFFLILGWVFCRVYSAFSYSLLWLIWTWHVGVWTLLPQICFQRWVLPSYW